MPPRGANAKRQRKVPPRISSAKGALSAEARERIFADQRSADIFRNVFKSLTFGRALTQAELEEHARASAERALGRDVMFERSAKERVASLGKNKYPKVSRSQRLGALLERIPGLTWNMFVPVARIIARLPESKQIIFRSGAKMDIEIVVGPPIGDIPTTRELYGIRFCAKPSQSERKLPGFGIIDAELRKNSKGAIEGTSGSVGYLGCTLHKAKREKRHTAVIWTRQVMGLPDIKEPLARRYKNWDSEMMRYLEHALKKAGVARIAVATKRAITEKKIAAPPGVLLQYLDFDRALGKIGYKQQRLDFEDLHEYYSRHEFRVKEL